ncbi:hypothetical protein APED_32425 [Acanthopleuribacter pedis]
MSDLRIGLVVEGTTDFIVLEAALTAILKDRTLSFTRIQPSDDATFALASGETGWGGVLRWCRQHTTALQNSLLAELDLVILHVDADVASKQYGDVFGTKPVPFNDLPCEKPCPPASDTVNALREVVLGWVDDRIQKHWVICIPSKSIESWLVPVFFMDHPEKISGLECNVQVAPFFIGKKGAKLIRRRGSTCKKLTKEYRAIASLITERWTKVTQTCEQARRFESSVKAVLTE